MGIIRLFILLFFVAFIGCHRVAINEKVESCTDESLNSKYLDKEPNVRGALLSTRFTSFDELKTIIQIEYSSDNSGSDKWVRLIHCSNGQEIISVLRSGISENDFVAARDEGLLDRLNLLVKSPYSIIHRKDLQSIYTLARRRPDLFGAGDPAFYDLSERIMHNINNVDAALLNSKDLTSEKGYFNTINHIISQALTTSIFSERLADFIADAHERKTMPELITGKFTEDQVADLENGPVDNYVDMINNEWGQELGKLLKKKYNIDKESYWSADFLATYLNELQRYYSWSFQIGFEPFTPEDEIVIKFSNKINKVMEDLIS